MGECSYQPTTHRPQWTIFYIDLRHYEWDVNDGWTTIEAEYPYHIGFDAPTQTALKAQLTRLQGEMNADIHRCMSIGLSHKPLTPTIP